MAYTTIDKPTDYFNTVLYTGNGSSSRDITGVGFQPDWVWIKIRSHADNHNVTDSVRGATKTLEPNNNVAEATYSTVVSAFISDGFTVGNSDYVNANTRTYASWNWLAGGTASSNTDGSITSSVSANTTAGFSIVKYTGAGVGTTTTIGHGLGGVPEMYIVKSLDSVGNWQTYHHKMSSAPETDYIQLDNTSAVADFTFWGDTAPTSTVFTVKDGNDVNESGEEYIAYCFRSIKGYSKIGSYTANANTDGPFVYTGFKPAYILVKNSTSSLPPWIILDNKRNPYNQMNIGLKANASEGDSNNSGNNACDFLSNGFKVRAVATGHLNNASGDNNIYMAFAESPFVTSTGIPTTAR